MAKRVSVKGKGADLFFGEYQFEDSPAATATGIPDEAGANLPDDAAAAAEASGTPDDVAAPDTTAPTAPRPMRASQGRKRKAVPASTLASAGDRALDMLASPPDPAVIEAIRKTVKQPGREVSFVRLTPTEKGRLTDIVYTYKRQGIKTSENEINRIAVNFLMDDYHQHGERSILAMVIAALRA